MSDRVDPITEEKESEVNSQDLQEDAAEKEDQNSYGCIARHINTPDKLLYNDPNQIKYRRYTGYSTKDHR